MAETQTSPLDQPISTTDRVVNDFSITFCTINGSGSQTANLTVLRALCHMGIPVSGKNIFPSNIQGQPTWYTIRANRDGYLGRKDHSEVVVAVNPNTLMKDMEGLQPGGVLFYADDMRLPVQRQDIVVYPMPIKKLAKEADIPSNLRDYIANMVYVGVVSKMLHIDLDEVYKALDFHFKGKQKPIDSNFNVVKAGADWAAANLEKKDPYEVERMDTTQGCRMVDGNSAAALGAAFGGVQFAAWYPITPASTLPESLNEYLPQLRKDPVTGKNTYAVVQAEDEIAAIGMAVGAGWAGLRAMTATSGPGLSLMTEYAGLAYYSEVPVVIWDIQRVGPSTGLPTRTAQADLTEIYFFSHGDTQHIMLFPGSVNECFDFGWKAFDIAERMQSPVFVLSDLDLGMNVWMSKPFDYPDRPMDRGKVLWEEDINQLNGEWSRYLDVDGDGIPYRTVIGNKHPRGGYFNRGTGHDENARYTEDPEVWERVMNRLRKKYATARSFLPEPILRTKDGAKAGIIAFGSSDPAVQEAQDELEKAGLPFDYLRLRSIPFNAEVEKFIQNHDEIYVVEMNRDGQLRQILTINYPEYAGKFKSAAHLDGMPLTARWIRETICAQEEK